MKFYSAETQLIIIRVNHECLKDVWSAMTLVTEMKKRDVQFRILHVAGGIPPPSRPAAAVDSDRLAYHQRPRRAFGPGSVRTCRQAALRLHKELGGGATSAEAVALSDLRM